MFGWKGQLTNKLGCSTTITLSWMKRRIRDKCLKLFVYFLLTKRSVRRLCHNVRL